MMIKLAMECLAILWFCIDVAVFLLWLPPLRKRIIVFSNAFHQRTIEKKESWRSRIANCNVSFGIFSLTGLMIFVIVWCLSNQAIEVCLGIHNAIFIVSFLPIICGGIGENKYSFWRWISLISAALFSCLGYVYFEISDKDAAPITDTFWVVVKVSLSIFVTALLMVVIENVTKKVKENRKRSKHKPRTDLFFRTPKLTENITDKFDLIRFCERLFGDYRNCYDKVNEIDSVEYVNLSGTKREKWYSKAAEKMRWFWIISLLFGSIFVENGGMFLGAVLLFYALVIYIYQKTDETRLQVIGLRYFYFDWGYCLVSMEEEYFVGEVQLLERTRYHKFVYSFMDVAALCRAVAIKDTVEQTRDIQLVSQNFGSLFMDCWDKNKEKDWVEFIPLWIVALFEYEVTRDIASSVKEQIGRTICKENREKIHMFILSFWCDMKRKKPNEGITEFIGGFEKRFKEMER